MIFARLTSQSSKVSGADRNKTVADFKTALGHDWTVYKEELPKGLDETAALGNEAILRLFTKTNDHFLQENGIEDSTMESVVVSEVKEAQDQHQKESNQVSQSC